MRGLIPAHIMSRIEQETGLRMADMVDVFCGPSTGAILNSALTLRHPDYKNRPKYRARHMVRFYEREGVNIFPIDRFREFRGLIHDFNNRTMRLGQLNSIFRHGHYDPRNLGIALKALFGDAKLSDSIKSLIVPTYNIDGEQLRIVSEAGDTENDPVYTKNNVTDQGGHAVWLKNILFNKNLPSFRPPQEVALYDAVMASAAAPTYFPCHHFQARESYHSAPRDYAGIDGSIFDNPCITYLGALRQHLAPGQKLTMIGLGTGYTNRSVKKEDWNRFGSLGVVDPVNDLPLINIFFHASESALMETFASEMGDDLYILNKSLISGRGPDWPGTQIDDGSPENLARLKNFAEMIIEDNKTKFDKVCDLLVRNYEKKEGQKYSLLNTIKDKIPFLGDKD